LVASGSKSPWLAAEIDVLAERLAEFAETERKQRIFKAPSSMQQPAGQRLEKLTALTPKLERLCPSPTRPQTSVLISTNCC
jgi:hypothetical protein